MVEKAVEKTIDSSSVDVVYLDSDILRKFMSDIFIGLEVPQEDAEIISDVLITSDLRGIDSHGIQRCKMYYDRIKAGIYNPKTDIEVVNDNTATALIDGHCGMGHVIAFKAMNTAIEK
ncbi:MAG: Ldh family oxidoreductase, partial [Promethearchaeota archaeon]